MPMLAIPASTQSSTHMRALPSPITGRAEGTDPGPDEGFFVIAPERGPDEGDFDGIRGEGFVTGTIDAPGGTDDASKVSLGTFSSRDGGASDPMTPIAGMVTAKASVPSGDVA